MKEYENSCCLSAGSQNKRYRLRNKSVSFLFLAHANFSVLRLKQPKDREEHRNKFNRNDDLKLFRHIQNNRIFYKTCFKLGWDSDYKILLYGVEQAKNSLTTSIWNTALNFSDGGVRAAIKKSSKIIAPKHRKKSLKSHKASIEGERTLSARGYP